jgi:primary-amine oxidase
MIIDSRRHFHRHRGPRIRALRFIMASAMLFLLIGAGEAEAIVCPGGSTLIDETLPTGGRWEMCWAELPQEGVVLRDVHFTPPGYSTRRILKEASVAQIHVVYDDDRARRHIVTEDGLGGSSLVDLASAQCPDGVLLSDGSQNVLCQREAGRGYSYKDYSEQLQGHWLELFHISRTGDLTWIVRWRFYDDGSIEPGIASTGTLHELGTNSNFGFEVGGAGEIGVGWIASYYWRLDFDIGTDGSDDLVERFEVAPSGDGSTKSFSISTLATELGESLDPANKRSWRVRDQGTTNADGHPVSYHLEPLQAGHRYVPKSDETFANHDFYVTRYDACERFASQNPTGGGCGADLAAYLGGQGIEGEDIVLWYRLTNHHFPRDEDSPYLSTRWQSFLLAPRDWTDVSPLGFRDGLEVPRDIDWGSGRAKEIFYATGQAAGAPRW